MTSHRRIILTAFIVAALPAATPAFAAASSLLSGYGGPGQGSQAILGSTLLGGGSDGGEGGPPGSTGARTGSPAEQFRYSKRSDYTKSSTSSAAGGGGSARGGASGSRVGVGGASGGGASTYPSSAAERADEAGAVASEPLGLSGDDLLFVLLSLVALVLTGLLTRQLARMKGSGGRQPLKGRVAGPE
jgi:hypothetical protein